MEISKKQITEIMQFPQTVFQIPVYQRNYKWEIDECLQLLEDILAVGSNEKRSGHFLGSIVYIKHGNTTIGSVQEYAVIDGQQRLTTLTLIFCVLYLLAKERCDERGMNNLKKFIINDNVDESEKLKLKPTEDYADCLKHILGESSDNIPKHSRLIENFKFFQKKITNQNSETVQKGIAKLVLVQIQLDEHDDDPQQIFESLNAKGKPLEQSDLIRNYILMTLPEATQTDYYNRFWKPIEQNTKDESLEKERTSAFIRDFLTYKTYLQKRKIINESKVYDEFKFYRQETHEDLVQLLNELKSLSEHYRKLLNPKYETDNEIRKHLEYINRLKVGVIYPFLMPVFADYHSNVIDKETFIAVLELCQAYVFRRAIVNLATGPMNKIFAALYEKIDKNDYLRSLQRELLSNAGTIRFPSNDEVRRELKVRDVYNFNVHYLFERLENYQNKERVMLPSKDITVEHIFPQLPDANWKQQLPQNECDEIAKSFLHTIGNLTLSGNNGALGNQTFVKKCEMNVDGKEQGYRYSRLWLNRDLKNLTAWNKAEIERRCEHLTERFLQVWQYPDVVIERRTVSFDEVNIFDAGDPTGLKLDYAVFNGEQLRATKITELYIEIVKKLFMQNKDKFLRLHCAKRLLSTNQQVLCRETTGHGQFKKIDDMYYLLTQLSSQDKVKNMKMLLTELGLRDALRIKYQE
ncbi:MAG: DUF262 domain-containing protein [Planctomycetaceae bacterium]|nr:DUF262 domain-containing protein [Planctomycetaceae bacterium]